MDLPIGTNPEGDIRIIYGALSFSPAEARDLAIALGSAASYAERLPDIHERHVNLMASCPLCVHEANGQLDRLTNDEDDEG